MFTRWEGFLWGGGLHCETQTQFTQKSFSMQFWRSVDIELPLRHEHLGRNYYTKVVELAGDTE